MPRKICSGREVFRPMLAACGLAVGGWMAADRILFVSGLAIAQEAAKEPATGSKPAHVSVAPGVVTVQQSRIYVFVDKRGVGHQHGVEAKLVEGKLALGAEKNAGQLVFDMKSFDADTDAARRYVGLSGSTDAGTRQAVNENMRGSAILDVNRFPTATFDVDSAKATGETSPKGLPSYLLQGNFTLHGTTRPLSIVVDAEQVKGWLHVRGNFTINQTDYGIRPYSKAFGAIGVTNQLRIYGDLYVAPTDNVVLSQIPQRS